METASHRFHCEPDTAWEEGMAWDMAVERAFEDNIADAGYISDAFAEGLAVSAELAALLAKAAKHPLDTNEKCRIAWLVEDALRATVWDMTEKECDR